jgi:hypothetical protein
VQGQSEKITPLKISKHKRFFTTSDGSPFFWLGDTGWLLFGKLDRDETEKYLEDRRQKGFNVIQVMVLHNVNVVNRYGDSALVKRNVAMPNVTKGNSASDSTQYDFWDHVDFVIDRAAEKGIYMALVPVWGNNVKSGNISRDQAKTYVTFLANRYKNRPNIVWLNGGDIKATDSLQTWKLMGNTLNAQDPNHLITFHPFGRMQSSLWFHNEPWLDFNMFQSGHRRYEQDTMDHRIGEDNWKYVNIDYNKKPVKPTLDGEPSYENIPHGLHDSSQPKWQAADVRRYGYWSVFAGGCGYTYGDNAVMQMRRMGEKGGAYGARDYWFDAINDPGASQMVHLKTLMLSRPYFDRVPDQSLIAGIQGSKYDYLLATRGENYAFIYTYNGKTINVNMGKIKGTKVKASWFSPRDGSTKEIGSFDNKGVLSFDAPGEQENGNDWVLLLDSM